MPTKIFFASAEETNKSLPPLNRRKVRYRLASYHYMRPKSEKVIEKILYDVQPRDAVFFIDSGAFTTMQKTSLAKAKKDPAAWWDWAQKYVDDYALFLTKHRERLFCAAEFDVDSILGVTEVFEACPEKWYQGMVDWWNKEKSVALPPPVLEWRKILEQSGVPILPTFHDNTRDVSWWADEAKAGKYLALASGSQEQIGKVFSYLNVARKNRAPVHGFGLTKPDWIRKLPYFSVDSTTWLDGSKYGTTMLFQNGRLRYYMADKRAIRRKYKHMYESWGIDWSKVEAGDAYTMDECNLISWLQYAKFIANSPAVKDYWPREPNGAPKGSLGPPCDDWGEDAPEEPLDYVPGKIIPGVSMPDDEFEAEVAEVPLDAADDSEEVEEAEAAPPQKNALREQEPAPSMGENLLECDNCILNTRCRYFEEGARCHYNFAADFNSPEGVVKVYTELIQIQYRRVQFAAIQEQVDGGQLDNRLSAETRTLQDMIHGLKDLVAPPEAQEEVRVRGPGAVSMLLQQVLGSGKPELPGGSEADS